VRQVSQSPPILRLIRPVPTSSPETATLRAEIEGLRLALSIAQDALREERADKQHWRDEANTFGNCWRDISPRPKSPSRRRPPPMRPRSLLLPTPSRTVRTRKWVQQTQQADATAGGAGSSPDAASPRNIIGTGVRAALVRALARELARWRSRPSPTSTCLAPRCRLERWAILTRCCLFPLDARPACFVA
jgi:hypothetical protein